MTWVRESFILRYLKYILKIFNELPFRIFVILQDANLKMAVRYTEATVAEAKKKC